jgi:hydrogenase maturation protease
MAYDRKRPTLVLGLGNDILRDDGVGLCAARRVAEFAGDRADHAEACLATIDLLPVIAGYDRVIVVDAYVSDAEPPGTPVCGTPEDLPGGFGYRSNHTLPFRDMLAMGRKWGLPMPRHICIHGLTVAEASTFGQAFTPAVGRAWRPWAEAVARAEFGEVDPEPADGALSRARPESQRCADPRSAPAPNQRAEPGTAGG